MKFPPVWTEYFAVCITYSDENPGPEGLAACDSPRRAQRELSCPIPLLLESPS